LPAVFWFPRGFNLDGKRRGESTRQWLVPKC
jgi:hypothetical protein